MVIQENSIQKRREGKFSEIITIPANDSLVLDFTILTKWAPFLNYIFRNKSSFDISYYINNSKEFDYMAGGEILQEEAEVINEIKFVNDNASDVQLVVNFNNKITMLELEKRKAGVMIYGRK
jgi:hypothetical protein